MDYLNLLTQNFLEVFLIPLFCGLAIGVLLGRMFLKKKMFSLEKNQEKEQVKLNERIHQLNLQKTELEQLLHTEKSYIEDLRQKLNSSEKEFVKIQTLWEKERENNAEQRALLKEAEKKLDEAFRATSSRVISENSKNFLTLANEKFDKLQSEAKGELDCKQKEIDDLIKPLKESLNSLDEKIKEMEKTRSGAYSSIYTHLGEQQRMLEQLGGQTQNLVAALRSPTVRGNWGEMQLRRVVELSGMIEHCDFDVQLNVEGGEGNKLRPDLIIHMPNGRKLIIDAKTPLQAYLDALEAEVDTQKQQKLRTHALHIRDHIKQLSSKEYWSQFEDTPEFTVLFLPGEAFFSTALQQDPSLIEFGVSQKVIVATPTTLIALLKAIAYGWKQEKLAQSASQISYYGAQMHQRLATLAEHFALLKRSLDSTVKAYNKAVSTLDSRVMVTARKFEELGAKSSKDLVGLEKTEWATCEILPFADTDT